MADERERLQGALHQMRDAFCDVREARTWEEREQLTGQFFDGYAETKRIFAQILLVRDVMERPA